DASVVEGDSGTATATFTLSLSMAPITSVWVTWSTASGTAIPGLDYNSASGNVIFSTGETTETVSVTVRGDVLFEPNETFFVNISTTDTVVGDSQGVGTIVDDDPYVLTVDDPSASEAAGAITFTVSLSQANTQEVRVDYATRDYLAVAGQDYTATSGTLVFAPGETAKTVTVQVLNDNLHEGGMNEWFYLDLSNPV